MRLAALIASLCFLIITSAWATSITQSGPTLSVGFRIETGPSGNIQQGNQTGFGPLPLPVPLPDGGPNAYTANELFSLVFVQPVPPFSSLNSATLDLYFSWGLGVTVVSGPSSWLYVPDFGAEGRGGEFLTVESGGVSYALPSGTSSIFGLDLLDSAVGLGSALAAGNDLTVRYREWATFTANYDSYDRNSAYGCVNCVRTFTVSLNTGYGTLYINDGSPEQPPLPGVPEPASLVLIGGGLVVLGWLSRKRIRT